MSYLRWVGNIEGICETMKQDGLEIWAEVYRTDLEEAGFNRFFEKNPEARQDLFVLPENYAESLVLSRLNSNKIAHVSVASDFLNGPESALIRVTTRVLAAALSGCKRFHFETHASLPAYYLVNLLYLIFDEAKVSEGVDALKGSAVIEALSKKVLKDYTPQIGTLPAPAGEFPFVRGPYQTMYQGKPWTIRQYAGFSTAEESNRFYRDNLKAGQKGLSVAFDLATHRGYDSDHPRVAGDVGMAGVAIDTVEDMKRLFDQIDLGSISVSMTMNGAVLPVLAFYIVAAEEQGVARKTLSGTIQNDILKEFMVRNTYIYPPEPSMRIVGDIFEFCSKEMPRFNPISISGYHMHEAGAPPELELAYTIADGLEYVRTGLKKGLDVDAFAPRLSFFWAIGMDHVTEVSKLRAGRWLWAEYMKRLFSPKDARSMTLRAHSQTSGWSLTAQDPLNNVGRTTIEALSAVIGHTQSLHTNALDEAIALPTPYSAKIARDTQLYLQKEAGLCEWIDLYGGAERVEEKTEALFKAAAHYIDEVESMGGMTAAIVKGLPKRRIEEAALLRQVAIDRGEEALLGVNRRIRGDQLHADTLSINADAVRVDQVRRLQEIKTSRNTQEVASCLEALEEAAQKGTGNLLDLSVKAAKARATIGEISLALEKVWGRYLPKNKAVSGIYTNQMKNDQDYKQVHKAVEAFAMSEGRQPRILIAKMGQDGHDRGARVIAASFVDMGFDVDLGPMFQTPEEVARQAIDHDVHVIGVSSLAAGHTTLVPALLNKLRESGRDDIVVVVGGIVPEGDVPALKKQGVAAVIGPGTKMSDAALEVLKVLQSK